MTVESEPLAALPHLLRDVGGPVFAEPWQAQAFALTVNLSEQGNFTWKEWAAALAHELQAAANRGEPDDGSRYYEHWLAALERLVTAKGLADSTALITRKEAWTAAYRSTPHGRPVELPQAPARPDGRWLLIGLASAVAAYGMTQAMGQPSGGPQAGFAASAGLGTLLGMRHALEPDHLAALSVLLTGERSVRKAAWLGVYWGIGHTLTLLAAGTLLVVLRAEMPAIASEFLSWAVALMLVGFGLRAIYLSASPAPAGPTHSHVHGVDRAPIAIRVHRPVDARPATAARGRGPRSRGQRRAHRAGHGHDSIDGGTPHVLGVVWRRFDVGHGGAVGAAGLADRARWDARYRRARRFPHRRLHLDHARTVLGLSAGWPLVLDRVATARRINEPMRAAFARSTPAGRPSRSGSAPSSSRSRTLFPIVAKGLVIGARPVS